MGFVLLEAVVLDPIMLRTKYMPVGCKSLVQLRNDGRKRNPYSARERNNQRA